MSPRAPLASLLAAGTIACTCVPPGSAAAATLTYIGPGTSTFTVPAGVTSLHVAAVGAGGVTPQGLFPDKLEGQGGPGGTASGSIAVAPGQLVRVIVGARSTGSTLFAGGGKAGGGGGSSVALCAAAGCGSGATTQLVAGGGGGGGQCGYVLLSMCAWAGGAGGSPGTAGGAGEGDGAGDSGGGGGSPGTASASGAGGSAGLGEKSGVAGSPGSGSVGGAAVGSAGGGGGAFGGGGGGGGGTTTTEFSSRTAGEGGGGGGSSLVPAGGSTGIALSGAPASVTLSWADPAATEVQVALTREALFEPDANASTLSVVAVGGAGGAGDDPAVGPGGQAGTASGAVTLAPGQTLSMAVGTNGFSYAERLPGQFFGSAGFPDGARGGYGAGGGGGSSRVSVCPAGGCGETVEPLIVAGGGGGGGGAGVPTEGFPAHGGAGGNAGTAGATGGEDGAHDLGGGGGQATGAGGAAGAGSTSPVTGTAGQPGYGGYALGAGPGAGSTTDASMGEGGGGGGGGAKMGAGGGGSGGFYLTDGDFAGGGGGGGGVGLAPPGGTLGTAPPGSIGEVTIGWTTPPAPPGAPTGGSAPPGAVTARAAPKLTGLSQSARSWVRGNKLPALNPATITRARRHRHPVGTTFSFNLDAAATVTFAFGRSAGGQRVSGHCIAPKRGRHARSCTRTVTVARLTFTAHAGLNRLVIQGALSPTQRLAPGRYTVAVSAASPGGLRSGTQSLTFDVLAH